MPSDFILDTVALRVMTFAHRDGLTILLKSLSVSQVRCPSDVYNRDEHVSSLQASDEGLSELARGLRYAERQVLASIAPERYQEWSNNAVQLSQLLGTGALVIETLTLDEAQRRDDLMLVHGVGAGEAACLTLMERNQASGVFVSSDRIACRLANELGLSYITLEDVLDLWVSNCRPTREEFDGMAQGMRAARYAIPDNVLLQLRALL